MKPYVKWSKPDAADAEAICEVVTRPTMRFVEIKTPINRRSLRCTGQGILWFDSARNDQHVVRAVGRIWHRVSASVGHATLFAKRLFEGEVPEMPDTAGNAIAELCEQLLFLHGKIANYTHEMTQVARREDRVALLQTIPGIGPITASAIVATIGTGKQFRMGRDFVAWLGLTLLNRSSGDKERLELSPRWETDTFDDYSSSA